MTTIVYPITYQTSIMVLFQRERRRTFPGTLVSPSGDVQVTICTSDIFLDTSTKITKGQKWPERECLRASVKQPFVGKDKLGYTNSYYSNVSDAQIIAEAVLERARGTVYLPLDFQKNDNAELFTALADLDGTIAMFGRKFIRDLASPKGIGAVQWGILPFVGEVKSLYDTLGDLFNNGIADSLSKYSGQHISRSFPLNHSGSNWTFAGTSRLNGTAQVDPSSLPELGDYLPIMLDELGVHPDLKTLWDVIPLSFAVDYVIPVGDYLESLHPRGWFNPTINFKGTVSVKGTATVWDDRDRYHTWNIYVRGKATLALGSRNKSREVPWEPPSLVEGMNIGYLHSMRGRR